MQPYIGRFAPSPTGPLHIGSLVAAMASYLDAKVHHGLWYLRIEDNDFDRNQSGAKQTIIHSLQRCGMQWDGDIVYQSQRGAIYQAAFLQLGALIYPCACSRKEILDSRLQQGQAPNPVYPGTCRDGLPTNKTARSFRLRVPLSSDEPALLIDFTDRFLGPQQQNLSAEVGDFILKRADGFWAYQFAVVVDDAAQGITDIVRGADLLESTARQIYLQRCLGLPTPRYLHVPVITNQAGEKLSKQTGAAAFDLGNNDLLQTALLPAAEFLGLKLATRPRHLEEFWALATMAWSAKINALPTHST